MDSAASSLKAIIDSETNRVEKLKSPPSYHAIQHILRRLDLVSISSRLSIFENSDKMTEFFSLFDFGWAPALKRFYTDINLDTFKPYPLMAAESVNWVDSLVTQYGKLIACKQLIDFERAGFITLRRKSQYEFTFSYTSETSGIDYFDTMSLNFFRENIVERIIEFRKTENSTNYDEIKKAWHKIIKCPDGKMIQYHATPEISAYYDKQGHYHVLRLQGYDDFGIKDTFGGIEYWRYIDLIEILVGGALQRKDACLELRSINQNINLHNILSYTHYKDKTIQELVNYLDRPTSEIKQILSCVTLTKENYNYYLELPGAPPPMFFQVSNNLLVKSVAGCLENPFDLLNRELKRRFKRDYDIAVNNREKRFRDELYTFFPHQQVVKIPREINISFDGIKTDIDATVYDTETKMLGLFQLKWQDQFGHSMVERRSRMTNLFPKAHEWIEKMRKWVYGHEAKTVLNSLQIDKYWKGDLEIKGVCVFIISRNQMNFTGVELDQTVAWGSWHQLIESQSRFKTSMHDPITEMFNKLKSFSPSERMKFENLPRDEDFELTFNNYKVYYQAEK